MKNSLEEQNKEIVRKYWDGKWNERRPEILDELLSTDIKYHGEDEMTGIEEYKIYPVGEELHFRFFTVFRLVDGKIAEEWELYQ